MIDVVIINKSDKVSDLLYMSDSLKHSKNIYKTVYVADRCSKEFNQFLQTEEDLFQNLYYVILADGYEGRRTSSLRNIGYDICKKDDVDGIVFVDGDRWFVEGNIEDIDETIVNNIPLDNIRNNFPDEILMGMRNEVHNAFYSACVYIPMKVCKKLEVDSKLWNETLESVWGVEDLYMGNQLSILDIPYIFNRKIRLNNEKCTGYKNESFIKNLFLLMQEIEKFKQLKLWNAGE